MDNHIKTGVYQDEEGLLFVVNGVGYETLTSQPFASYFYINEPENLYFRNQIDFTETTFIFGINFPHRDWEHLIFTHLKAQQSLVTPEPEQKVKKTLLRRLFKT